MKYVFFDLETSDLNPVGQILNYAFVEVDEDWNTISSLCGDIKISPLQLPVPEAILSNKIDVLRHQKESKDCELAAMTKIHKYIEHLCEYDSVRLMGYNSNSFDVHYLRTSLIRNGFNPYFGGQLVYGDVLHLVNKLSVSNDAFLSILSKKDSGKPSLSLESVSKAVSIIPKDETQKHESLYDVNLTIKLAKKLNELYSIDIREYQSYEITKRYTEFDAIEVYPYFDENGNKVSEEKCYYTIHDHNKSSALWINLKKFESGLEKDSILWCNKNTSQLFIKRFIRNEQLRSRCDAARQALSHITLENFWPDKFCDIEQSIYTLPINEIRTLSQAIHSKDLFLLKENKNKFSNVLYLRFLCNNVESDEVDKIATKYIDYRYGGKMRLDKKELNSPEKLYHPTYDELLQRVEKYYSESGNPLMQSLKEFYLNSKISKVCKNETLL